MAVRTDQDRPSPLLNLLHPWLAGLVRHVAAGPGGLTSAASLSQTCKALNTMSDSPAVTYSNLHVDNAVRGLDHPMWQWIRKRHGRVAGLSVELALPFPFRLAPGEEQLLPVIFAIPNLQLTLSFPDTMYPSLSHHDPIFETIRPPHPPLLCRCQFHG